MKNSSGLTFRPYHAHSERKARRLRKTTEQTLVMIVSMALLLSAAGTAANGDISVTDEDDGDLTITLNGVESAKLPVRSDIYYDVQQLTSDGPATLACGVFNILGDVSRVTS